MWLFGDESRILANYSPGYDGVTTLAHELGHAYHNLNEAGLTPLQRTPMILAETASTFCETLVKEAALVDAEPGERIYILEQSAQARARWWWIFSVGSISNRRCSPAVASGSYP